jgi:hypothetical protein
MRCVAFRTPGLIPLESFTTFGVNVKPMTTSPFGYFGTGLKYAIAVALRFGCRIVLWRGQTRYEFFVSKQDFRGKDFNFVRMKRQTQRLLELRRAFYEKLPFTTELGRNWELWQAFRELETNTRDEGGSTYLLERAPVSHEFYPNETLILVEGDRFVDEFLDMGKHFLEGGKTLREDEDIQIIDRPSKHIYYRGVRIMDLKDEAEFTYNILRHVDLTEDRTAKYPFLIESMIADYWLESEDRGKIYRATHGTRWEANRLSFGYATATPSSGFRSASYNTYNPTLQQYLRDKDPSVATTTTVTLTVPKPEVTEVELADIAKAVGEILGVKMLTAKNAATDEEVKLEDLLPEQSTLVQGAAPAHSTPTQAGVADESEDISF